MISRKTDLQSDYFGNVPTAQFFVRFKNGKFFDAELNEEIIFPEEAILQIITNRYNIQDKIFEKIAKTRVEKILDICSSLFFKLTVKNKIIEFELVLDEDLSMTKQNNKLSRVNSCKYRIIKINGKLLQDKDIFYGKSLNQAYFQMSKKYNPDDRTHVCTVYKIFRTFDYKFLETFRF